MIGIELVILEQLVVVLVEFDVEFVILAFVVLIVALEILVAFVLLVEFAARVLVLLLGSVLLLAVLLVLLLLLVLVLDEPELFEVILLSGALTISYRHVS